MAYYIPTVWKSGGRVPRVPHVIAHVHSCFSADQMAKISLVALTVASLDNHLVLHARCNCQPFVFIGVWCLASQADGNGETVKHQ